MLPTTTAIALSRTTLPRLWASWSPSWRRDLVSNQSPSECYVGYGWSGSLPPAMESTSDVSYVHSGSNSHSCEECCWFDHTEWCKVFHCLPLPFDGEVCSSDWRRRPQPCFPILSQHDLSGRDSTLGYWGVERGAAFTWRLPLLHQRTGQLQGYSAVIPIMSVALCMLFQFLSFLGCLLHTVQWRQGISLHQLTPYFFYWDLSNLLMRGKQGSRLLANIFIPFLVYFLSCLMMWGSANSLLLRKQGMC